ncbi:MAG: SIMPL domain-containing protein [Nocardioides sp.]
MNRSITLSAKGALVALVAALALVVAYLLGNAGGTAQAAPEPTTTTGADRTLVMTGTGRTVGVPDELSFSLSVGVLRSDLKTALAAANATMNRELSALDRLGVRRADVQTTGLQMNAVYDYHSSGPPTLRGYHVGERAEVLVRDLSRGGSAVSAAVAAGGNDVRVGSIGLRIADPESLLAKSRAAAVAEATAKAKQYAAATGQTLGSVMSLKEVHATTVAPQPLHFAADSLQGVKGALPIRAGKDKLAVTVRIVWSFA